MGLVHDLDGSGGDSLLLLPVRCDLFGLCNVARILESCVAAAASGLVGICPTSAD